MTPPEPVSNSVANPLQYYGYYLPNGALKLDGALVDSYATLNSGSFSWTLDKYDFGMIQEYYTAVFYVSNDTVYLEVFLNANRYRFNGTTWLSVNGTTDASQVESIIGFYENLGIDANLLTLFANGSVSL